MTAPRALPRTISLTRVAAIARVRIIRVIRSRLAIVALLIVLPPWMLVDGGTLLARMSALAEFSVAGLTVVAAGALADDLDNGEYAIAVTHATGPVELLAGYAAASFLLVAALVALQLPIALAGPGWTQVGPALLCIAWLAALLAGWLGLMLLLATWLEGKANALAMAALFVIVPVALTSGFLDRLPAAPAAIVRSALQLAPQLNHVNAIFRALLYRSSPPALAPVIVLVSPIVYFAFALLRLYRIEPAGRLTQ